MLVKILRDVDEVPIDQQQRLSCDHPLRRLVDRPQRQLVIVPRLFLLGDERCQSFRLQPMDVCLGLVDLGVLCASDGGDERGVGV